MRLLSLAPSNTEILFALGVGEELVGITNLCDYPKETKNIEKIGSWISTEPEKMKKLRPDLIFTSTFMPDSLKDWKGPGIVIHVEPKTLSQVYQSIKYIGKVIQRNDQARKVIEEMKKEFTLIQQYSNKAMKQSSPPRIYAEEWPKPPMVSGNWVPELISVAGGTARLSKQGKPSSIFEFNTLEKFDPDLMIFHWCGADFWRAQRDKRSSPAIRQRRSRQAWQWSKSVENRPGWKKLRTIQQKKFFVIDDSLLNRPGPRLVLGAKMIQKCIQKYLRDSEA